MTPNSTPLPHPSLTSTALMAASPSHPSTCRFLTYYCGPSPSTSTIAWDTFKIFSLLLFLISISYFTFYIITYLERRTILRKLFIGEGRPWQQRYDKLMEMCEKMGWKGGEVGEWRRMREVGMEMQQGVNRGVRREWEDVDLA
jgi:hypothetical protein